MHKYVLDRYRKRSSSLLLSDSRKIRQSQSQSEKYREKVKVASLERQKGLWKSARKILLLLRRASQGYHNSLEKVLMLAYGRVGAKKYSLLYALIRDVQEDKILNSNTDVEDLLRKVSIVRFGDEWEPPEVLTALLKSQNQVAFPQGAYMKRFKVNEVVKVPKLNSWQMPMPEVRRKNIRKRYFNRARFGALPPLDSAELNVLRGLISGAEPWKPPTRRATVSPPAALSPLETFLSDGPQNGLSFRKYVLGRPHRLTRRLMSSLWEQIYHLTPQRTTSAMGKPKFDFPNEKSGQPLTVSVKDEMSLGIFDSVDDDREVC
ncbi:hypothetical protein UA08_03067 [Talaromyces atroroseus]|uniref:LYR motif-containing protein Cup1-like N-terminal domain-containing protein n=1 Tax=Talaromyces atroroseus TaxID=1441469 RepID=A0A225ALF2_TALAT|nr:hypothetical protein UA08_03067 [Talaromyces atroroseus]OKL61730.1 hypothetical protein UA08_03067 [Talaromyces atroroseus]